MATVALLHKNIEVEKDGSGNYLSAQASYRASGYATEDAALAAVIAAAPAAYAGMPASGYRVDGERINDTTYKVDVSYEMRNASSYDDGSSDTDPEIRYSVRPRSVNRKHAISRIATNEGAPSFITGGTAINLGENGEIGGVDVTEGELTVTMTFYHPRSKITAAYVKAVRALAGTVNSGSFYGFDAGELRFDGMEVAYRAGQSGRVPTTYTFSFSPNVTSYPIPEVGGTLTKAGWDYFWIYYERITENPGAANEITRETAKAGIVDRIYTPDSFAGLGI